MSSRSRKICFHSSTEHRRSCLTTESITWWWSKCSSVMCWVSRLRLADTITVNKNEHEEHRLRPGGGRCSWIRWCRCQRGDSCHLSGGSRSFSASDECRSYNRSCFLLYNRTYYAFPYLLSYTHILLQRWMLIWIMATFQWCLAYKSSRCPPNAQFQAVFPTLDSVSW